MSRTPQELSGTVAHVVFPTGIDRRHDLGLPDRLDVYYGMVDSRIGVAPLDVPDTFSAGTRRRPSRSDRPSALAVAEQAPAISKSMLRSV